ncbi:lytic transglycosylase domain-containing protein [Sphingobium sp.]|uniref:lytic transglycosylase domain-containing protein n=1 Tax=Sphingobium sp. TaxID=1912891 RepID=UPI002C5DDF46|nr:lytic transglycosylase domain-containing protein [Sphingobium sp.]HUD92326.1 lytic transglycosylase domain-containing protein [Sphingobium sp.]
MITQSLKASACIAVLPLVLVAIIEVPADARISRRPSTEAQELLVRQCIHHHSQGRGWLARTLLALRQKEGGWIGAQVRNSNGSFDLGPMQVNDWWVPRIAMLIDRDAISVRTWLTHDPCFNVGTAKWIFLSALAQSKDYWQSIGIYHSPTRWRQTAYARDVARLLKIMPRASSAAAAGPNMPGTGD